MAGFFLLKRFKNVQFQFLRVQREMKNRINSLSFVFRGKTIMVLRFRDNLPSTYQIWPFPILQKIYETLGNDGIILQHSSLWSKSRIICYLVWILCNNVSQMTEANVCMMQIYVCVYDSLYTHIHVKWKLKICKHKKKNINPCIRSILYPFVTLVTSTTHIGSHLQT